MNKITFTIYESSAASPSYNVTYTSDKSGGTTQINSSEINWSSGEILLNQSQWITMTTDCTDPTFVIRMSVYVNGHLWERRDMTNPTSTMSIAGIP